MANPSPPQSLNKNIEDSFSLRYPIGKKVSSEDYLLIDILEYIAPGLSASSSDILSFDIPEAATRFNDTTKIKPIKQIALPIPSGVSESNTVGWAAGGINPFAAKAIAGSPIPGVTETQNLFQSASSGASSFIAGMMESIKSAASKDKNAAAIALAVSSITNQSEIQQALARTSGSIFNQNVELLFNSVNLRSPFTFNFTLSPRNETEGLYVKAIIKTFKKYMMPRRKTKNTANGLLIQAPHVFRLKYMHGSKDHPFLHKFKVCALTSMSVNYTGSNVYATYPDGTPVHLEMTLSFQELSPLYFEDYENSEGVGY